MSARPADPRDTPDTRRGMAWWNSLSEMQRAVWLQRAESSCPADAWELYKATAARPVRKEVAQPQAV